MAAYYNEIDPFCVEWLRNLIKAGLIADGDVDDRDIRDVRPGDVAGYTQCHFFAGIGGWSYALRLAGVPDDTPVWTGSCPCQPFSGANVAHGGAKGQADARHLWPDFYRIIRECRPSILFGEQVERAIGWGWLDEVFGDLEASDYACGAAIGPALSVGARHERKRLYWMAHANGAGRPGHFAQLGVSGVEGEARTVDGDALARAGRALDGDYAGLLLSDGVSVAVERCTTRGYGNAIVPQAAARFVQAAREALAA